MKYKISKRDLKLILDNYESLKICHNQNSCEGCPKYKISGSTCTNENVKFNNKKLFINFDNVEHIDLPFNDRPILLFREIKKLYNLSKL